MKTNTMMFGSLVSKVTAQALVWCFTGCFFYNNNWEKSPSHSGKKQFFSNYRYVYNGLCNEPKWLAGIDYLQRKNLKHCNLQKQAFLANTQHQCFALFCSPQDNTNKLAVEELQSFGIDDKLKLLTVYRYLTILTITYIHVHAHEHYELFWYVLRLYM